MRHDEGSSKVGVSSHGNKTCRVVLADLEAICHETLETGCGILVKSLDDGINVSGLISGWMWNAGKESRWYQGILFNFWANGDLSIQENKGCRRKNRFLGGV